MSVQTIISRDRIFKRCPDCKRYVGYVRCRYCGKKFTTPSGLFKHEAHCFQNPAGTCRDYGTPWSECPARYISDEGGQGWDCDEGCPRKKYLENHTLHTPSENEWEEDARLKVLAEIAATTVQPTKAVEA